MDEDPDLHHLLDEPASPASVDDLQAIVQRAARRMVRIGAALGVVVLALGGLGGYLIAQGGSSHNSVVATAGVSPESLVAPSGAGPTSTLPSGVETPGAGGYTHDFTRTTSAGVTLRAFSDGTQVAQVQRRVVEVSSSGMVGTVFAVQGEAISAGPQTQLVGTAEGAPVIVVTDFAPSTVTEATLATEPQSGVNGPLDQEDAMAPVGDFVALAVPVSAAPAANSAVGTLTLTDAAGHVIQTYSLTMGNGTDACSTSASAGATTSTTPPVCGSAVCSASDGPCDTTFPTGPMTCTTYKDGESCTASTATTLVSPTTSRSITPPIVVEPCVTAGPTHCQVPVTETAPTTSTSTSSSAPGDRDPTTTTAGTHTTSEAPVPAAG